MERKVEPKLQPAYIGKEEIAVESGTESAWQGQELAVKSDPIVDPGEGKPVILRHFFINVPAHQAVRPSRTQVFEAHKKQIEMNLWGDGLQPILDRPIEIHSRSGAKKLSRMLYSAMVQNNAHFVIQVLCEPKIGIRGLPDHMLTHTPTKLT